MARDENRHAVVRTEGPGGARGARPASQGGQLAVRHDLAAGNGNERLAERAAELRLLLPVERHVREVHVVAAEEADEPLRERVVGSVLTSLAARRLVPHGPAVVEPELALSPAGDRVGDALRHRRTY